jgi:biopolymer transport protein ExbD
MKNFTGKKITHTELNITSLIDVIFMLLIFFMIGARFDKPALAIALPTASSGKPLEGKPVNVAVDAQGIIYLEGEEVDTEKLLAAIRACRVGNPDLTVALDCDGQLVFQRVTEVMDILKSAGVHHAAIRHDLPR